MNNSEFSRAKELLSHSTSQKIVDMLESRLVSSEVSERLNDSLYGVQLESLLNLLRSIPPSAFDRDRDAGELVEYPAKAIPAIDIARPYMTDEQREECDAAIKTGRKKFTLKIETICVIITTLVSVISFACERLESFESGKMDERKTIAEETEAEGVQRIARHIGALDEADMESDVFDDLAESPKSVGDVVESAGERIENVIDATDIIRNRTNTSGEADHIEQ